MWEIVKKIKRKKEDPQTAIRSKEGKVLEEPEQIKARYLEHFTEILKNKPAVTDKQQNQEEMIDMVFDRIMDIANNNETILTTREEICNAVGKLKRKKCKEKTGWNNEIILDTGDDMVDGLLAMINKMEEERISPKQWSEMKIKTVKSFYMFVSYLTLWPLVLPIGNTLGSPLVLPQRITLPQWWSCLSANSRVT